MEIKNKTILVLGGYGEVGIAVCRQLLIYEPGTLVVTSLREAEAMAAVAEIAAENIHHCDIRHDFGNLFVRYEERQKTMDSLIEDPARLRQLVDDNLGELTEEILHSSTLHRLITHYNPDIIIDCINTATALAYRDVFYAYNNMRRDMEFGGTRSGTDVAYSLLATIAIPPLIRHVQILNEAMKAAGTQVYLKVGTTGTGGMGLNIPFTHGEESPSRLLMAKSALSGAQTMLLFTMNRTPGWPVVKEIKPAAMIGWKGVGKGKISRSGKEMSAYDCEPEGAFLLKPGGTFELNGNGHGKVMADCKVGGVFVDTGENGVFSRDEFKVITALGLMEFVTPEEIAHTAMLTILGIDGSKDVIGAIEGAVMDSTYQAGCLRESAVKRMDSMGAEGVCYGYLGPHPTKLIFEANLLRLCFSTIENLMAATPVEISGKVEKHLFENKALRIEPISLGIPILASDGQRLLFAHRTNRDKSWEQRPWAITADAVDEFASREWVDLRGDNMSRWQERFRKVLSEIRTSAACLSSRVHGGECMEARDGQTPIDAGEIVARVLIDEFAGGRDKAYASRGGKYI
ncbi:MAG: hypothetical protein A4E61_01250 [Syntrophorhabdus sp. PtaB.Bin184]|nr:MAG: hypothetical protein A4E61_01250 [Syntrophorhabdus sp. PtaB.Bin184]